MNENKLGIKKGQIVESWVYSDEYAGYNALAGDSHQHLPTLCVFGCWNKIEWEREKRNQGYFCCECL